MFSQSPHLLCVASVLLTSLLISCGSPTSPGTQDPAPSCEAGTNECPCYPNDTCNEGLECSTGVCNVSASCEDGSRGCACFGNGTCDAGLVCEGGVCTAQSTPVDMGDDPLELGHNTPDMGTVMKSMMVGPAGGTVTFEGGELRVPPGAVSAETEITVSTSTHDPGIRYETFGAVYEFGPDGIEFAQPVTIELPKAMAPSAAGIFWSNKGAPGYTRLPTTFEGGVARAEVTHFSSGFVGNEASDPQVACAEPIGLARVLGLDKPLAANIDARPLRTIEFDASSSTGDITTYKWEVVQKPVNSKARLVPNNENPKPMMFLDLVGEYVVELSVVGQDGTPGCQASTVTIDAKSTEALYIQLVWDTPGDGDLTDDQGADLDLHYLNTLGSWDTAPHDVYWANKTGDWGISGNPDDDPRLDVDNLTGAGPEVISHPMPSFDEDYSVGVYHYADNSFGYSNATVQVFVRGELGIELRDKRLEREGLFWYVADIEGEALDITEVNTIDTTFP